MIDPRYRPRVTASPLDDPLCAARAWAHYRRMMRWTAELALGMVGVVWVLIYHEFGLVSIHLYIAIALGLGLTIMLLGALMGLVFVSHSSGHDAAIDDPFDDETWR
jgi:hypothetical protein